MSAEIINLRRARKAMARREKEDKADANRALFGTRRADRLKMESERNRATRAHDQHRLDQHRCDAAEGLTAGSAPADRPGEEP